MPIRKFSTRSSIVSGREEIGSSVTGETSIKRHRRSGDSGPSALQCGSGSVASANANVGYGASDRLDASAQALPKRESSSRPAQRSTIARSKVDRPNIVVSASRDGQLGNDGI